MAPLRWESLGARPSESRDAAATRVEAAARVGLWAALAAVGAAERRGSRALGERLGDGSNYTICRAAVLFCSRWVPPPPPPLPPSGLELASFGIDRKARPETEGLLFLHTVLVGFSVWS